MAAWAVLEADALTLFRRWTRWVLFVADNDKEFEWDRLDADIREKPPETGRDGSCDTQSIIMLIRQPGWVPYFRRGHGATIELN